MISIGRPYYIFTSGDLKRERNSLALESEKERKRIPVNDCDEIFVFAEINLNRTCMTFLNRNDIPLHIFTHYGTYTGSFIPRSENVSGLVVIRQVEIHNKTKERMKIAHQFVRSAIYHMKRNVQERVKRVNEDLAAECIKNLEKFEKEVGSTKDREELMGLEGHCRRKYYSVLSKILPEDWQLNKRSYKPPGDPPNALISFCNGIVYAQCVAAIAETPLHPSVSFLHEPSERRYSLSLDLAEIFKPLVADRTWISLINRGQVKKKHFHSEGQGTFLTDRGRKKVTREMDKTLGRTIKHPDLKRKVSYRRIFALECYKLVRTLVEEEEYKALRRWW